MKRVLIVDDEVIICEQVSRSLTASGYTTQYCLDGKSALELIQTDDFDLIICDYKLPDFNGLDLLPKFKKLAPDLPVIFVTGYSDTQTAVQVIKMGAYNYLTKPLIPEIILSESQKALEFSEKQSTRKGRVPDPDRSKGPTEKNRKDGSGPEYDIVFGESKWTHQILKQIDLVSPTNYSVIIYGESGTGKEAIASTIHQRSKRADKPFIAVDCGTLSTELARSEFFGHEKGSFTGAINQKKGYFELAQGGTIFLDEVTNLSTDIQALLLRAIQERKIFRIGSQKEIKVDIRLITASNRKLDVAVAEGVFREDLYHRLNEFSLELEPLRKRRTDILLYANHFLNLVTPSQHQGQEFSEEVITIFLNYQWPGNIRELQNVVKRAALLCNNGIITEECIPKEIIYQSRQKAGVDLTRSIGSGEKEDNLKEVAHQAEKNKILQTLKAARYNKTKAAKMLNIDRKTLYNKIKQYSIKI